MKKKIRENTTEIKIIDNQCPIPLESLAVLINGDDNKKFNTLSKHISSTNVKVVLKHRSTGERVKVVVPIEFLEFHKIPYKFPSIPTNTQIVGVLDEKVKSWEVDKIVQGIFPQEDLVVLKCLNSGKTIACKVPVQDIQTTKLYIDKAVTKEKSYLNFSNISLWRESQCQREIQTRLNLSRLTSSITATKV